MKTVIYEIKCNCTLITKVLVTRYEHIRNKKV